MNDKIKKIILWTVAIIILILIAVCANYYLSDEFSNMITIGGI